jgi:hypothetical protein
MFSQNPIENGPHYSFAENPTAHGGELREHRFNP